MKAKADKLVSMNSLVEVDELTITINGKEMTFENEAAKNEYLA